MSEYKFDAIFKKIENALSASDHEFSVALLCGKAQLDELRDTLSQNNKLQLVILDGNVEKHRLKRELNARGCEFILYTSEFEPMIYELFNDGTTMLNDSLLVEE